MAIPRNEISLHSAGSNGGGGFRWFYCFFDRYFSQETNVTTLVMAKLPHKNT